MRTELTNENAKEIAWEWFAEAHPHEAYAAHPKRFWRFFHARMPFVTRDQMVALLKETDVDKARPQL